MFEVIAEQDGLVEGQFKIKLALELEQIGTAQRAYLVFVRHDFPPTPAPLGTVALCLRLRPGVLPVRTIGHCMQAFKEMFNTEESLDIIPIDERLEARIVEFCNPFYVIPQSKNGSR